MRGLLASLVIILPGVIRADVAGNFDYYVLSLSWSPNWCAIEGDARGSDQCDARHDHGWILHGLWPQFERGYPEYCQTSKRPPPRSMTAGMTDIMGTTGLAWHQWEKHGSCTDLEASEYYRLSRQAYEAIMRPPAFRQLEKTYLMASRVVEQAFMQANPGLQADQITVTCKQGYIQEARICLDRDLQPRACGADVIRDCALEQAIFEPVR